MQQHEKIVKKASKYTNVALQNHSENQIKSQVSSHKFYITHMNVTPFPQYETQGKGHLYLRRVRRLQQSQQSLVLFFFILRNVFLVGLIAA